MGLPNGGLRIVPHLRLVDGNAVHELGPANGGASGVGKGGRDDGALAPRGPEGSRELGGDVAPQGGVQLLVNDARTTDVPRHLHDTLRGEARGHGTRIGIEGNSVDIGGRCRLTVENHGGPVAGAHELHASIRGAGQIICDDSHQHVSTSAFQLFVLAEVLTG